MKNIEGKGSDKLNKNGNKNDNENLQPKKDGKKEPSKDNVPFTGEESTDSTDTKGTKNGGAKEDATAFEKSGKVEKISLVNSEKTLLNVFEELKGKFFYPLLLGKFDVTELQNCIFDAFMKERRLLKNAGAYESAKVLTETYKRFSNGCPLGVSLKTIQQTRMRIQTERKERRLQKELELKEKRITEIAKHFGLAVSTAKAMYLAGVLK